MTLDAQRWDRHYAEHEPPRLGTPSPRVGEELADLTPATALDLAAGHGRHAVWLAELGWHVTAVDFSEVALRHGRQLADERGVALRWVRADVVTWEPPPSAFQLVLVAYLHIEAAVFAGVLERAASAVAAGGRLVVVGYDLANRERDQRGPPEPSRLYSVEAVTAAVGSLVVERAEQVERAIEGADGERATAVDTVVRATRPLIRADHRAASGPAEGTR